MVVPGAESTATFRAKALYLCVRSLKGREGARQFVRAVDAGRIFDDETKPISRELWIRSLREFDRLVGEAGFRRLSRYLVHPKNLGVWSSLLRGATSPESIYAKLDETGGDQDYGWTWRQLKQNGRTWVGEICFLESDSDKDRRRIRKALSAELRAIPLLFGLSPAEVTSEFLPSSNEHSDLSEVVQTAVYEPAMHQTLRRGFIAAAFAGAAAAALGAALSWSGLERLYLGMGVAGSVSLLTFILARDVHYRALSRAQHLRILALEREGGLQKQQVKEISRPHEEPVIAGKYRLSIQLGVGAAGAVWEAKRLTDGARVAVKLLRTALAQDPRATDRLRREAQALGLSWHPHVVEVLDDGLLSSGVAFLVTELLDGETLGQRLSRGGRLPPSEVGRLGLQALDALSAIHSAGIVHRDIKPGNLFLHKQNNSAEILKLIDFGVASVSWAETRLTRHGARVGTRGYAAPEQEEGEEVDARADLFALGMSLKEALTGEPPEPDDAMKPVTFSEVPNEWQDFLSKLTAREVADRFASAKVARSELLKFHTEAPESSPASAVTKLA